MSASKIIGGTLLGLGALTDLGAVVGARNCNSPGEVACGVNPTGGLIVGTGMAGAGAWLWSQKTHSKSSGSHRRRGTKPTSHAAAIRRSRGVR